MKNEIIRRGSLLRDKNPRPNAWSKDNCTKWLVANKSNNEDLIFAHSAIINYIKKYKADMKKVDNSLSTKEICMYRLYEAFFCDELKDSFYKRNDAWDKTEVDGRNSEQMPLSYWELVCKKFNNGDWVPLSRSYPEFHEDYKEQFHLPFIDGENMTPETAKKEMLRARSALLVVSIDNDIP